MQWHNRKKYEKTNTKCTLIKFHINRFLSNCLQTSHGNDNNEGWQNGPIPNQVIRIKINQHKKEDPNKKILYSKSIIVESYQTENCHNACCQMLSIFMDKLALKNQVRTSEWVCYSVLRILRIFSWVCSNTRKSDVNNQNCIVCA